jgi:hypothetical protein
MTGAGAVAVSGSYAYVLDNVGLRVVNIASRTIVGTCPGYGNAITVDGSSAYVTNSTSGMRVIDVSTPTAPKLKVRNLYTAMDRFTPKVSSFCVKRCRFQFHLSP